MIFSLKAIAFDIDGTLYPNWALNIRAWPYVVSHLRLFYAFSGVRNFFHKTALPGPSGPVDFFECQANLLAERLRVPPKDARHLIETVIYQGLTPFFSRVKPFQEARETVQAFRDVGLKIALLSDFPPDQKGDVWGIRPLCDRVLSSEKIGALKPALSVFTALRDALDVDAEQILYVGNNLRTDIYGAHNAGMKTAWLRPFFSPRSKKSVPQADIFFKNYRQLREFVL